MPDSVIPISRTPFRSPSGGKDNGQAELAKGSRFMINKQSAVPLHIQLKEQIRYAIMSGDYPPGSPLPSIRELTGQLGIHRNTVHRVYLELQASGLLISRAGKGVFVSEALADTLSPKELNQMDALIARTFEQANAQGINPITLAKLVDQRAPAWDSRHPTIAFVECTNHQSVEFSRDLSDHYGVNVANLILEDLRQNPDCPPLEIRHLVTSIFHFDEVRELARNCGKRVHAITYDLHGATRNLLRQISPGSRLGFICHDANTEEIIGAQIEDRVPEGVLKGCANLEEPKLALALIKKVDTVILTEPASAFCIEHCTPDHELLELHFALNPASVEKVAHSVLFQP